MAKNRKENLAQSMTGRKDKPSEDKINKVASEVHSTDADDEKATKGFHIVFPKSHYDKLNEVSKKTHIPKKYIIMQALQDYYKENNY